MLRLNLWKSVNDKTDLRLWLLGYLVGKYKLSSKVSPQETFQCYFYVAFWLIRRHDVESTLKQRCAFQCWNLQRWINVVHFNGDINNVGQRRNNVVIFNVEFHNVGKRPNNIAKMTISKKNKNKNISNKILGIQSFNYYFIIFTLLPILRGICQRVLAKSRKFLKDHVHHAFLINDDKTLPSLLNS